MNKFVNSEAKIIDVYDNRPIYPGDPGYKIHNDVTDGLVQYINKPTKRKIQYTVTFESDILYTDAQIKDMIEVSDN